MSRERMPFLGLVLAVILVQLLTAATGTEYYLTQLIMAALYSIVVIGLCLLMGYAGQLSLGHAAFFAIGGYTAAVGTTFNLLPHREHFLVRCVEGAGLTVSATNSWGIDMLYLSPWVTLVAALLISGIVSLLIGIPVLRLRGHYLAMATLGFGTMVYHVLLGSRLLGEADGISDVPGFPLPADLVMDGSRDHRVFSYYLVWSLVVTILILMSNLVNSRAGRALRAIHGNQEAAEAMGVNTSRYKLYLFVLSALCATVAGVFMTHYNGGIGPSEAGVMKSVRFVAIVAVGGMASLWGTLSASMVLNFLSLRGYFGSLDDAVFGAVLIAVMLFAPEGILRRFRFDRLRRGQEAPDTPSRGPTEKQVPVGTA